MSKYPRLAMDCDECVFVQLARISVLNALLDLAECLVWFCFRPRFYANERCLQQWAGDINSGARRLVLPF